MGGARPTRGGGARCAEKKAVATAATETSRELSVVDQAPDVTGSHFGMNQILLAVRLVIDSAVSMRASSRVLNVMAQVDGRPAFDEPCHTTVQNFNVRIGLYLVQQRTFVHDDWIWIADHTIAVGTTKCFVVLGIRQSRFVQLDGPLQHHDMEPLALLPVEQSTGAIVHQQFLDLSKRYGVPVAVVSDRGTDLKKGVELLQKDHPDVIALYDIVHLVSRLIEKQLTQDERWDEYRKASCQCANALRQSCFSHLKPPRPKTKARYMNIDREVQWGSRALQLLDRVRCGDVTVRQQTRLPLEMMEAKFGWLEEYREAISLWSELSRVGQSANRVVRRHGYAADTIAELRCITRDLQHASSRLLAEQIIEQVEPMCEAVGDDRKLPGSSEVLESLIGRGKQLMGLTSGNSLTKQVLAMATATADLSSDLIRSALESCSMKNVRQWCVQHLPRSLQSLRQADLTLTKEEQKLRKPLLAATPDF